MNNGMNIAKGDWQRLRRDDRPLRHHAHEAGDGGHAAAQSRSNDHRDERHGDTACRMAHALLHRDDLVGRPLRLARSVAAGTSLVPWRNLCDRCLAPHDDFDDADGRRGILRLADGDNGADGYARYALDLWRSSRGCLRSVGPSGTRATRSCVMASGLMRVRRLLV